MRFITAFLIISFWSVGAFAQSAFDYKLQNKVQTDQGKPSITLVAKEFIQKGEVIMKRSDGKTQKVTLGKMRPMKEKRIVFQQPKGTFKYTIKVKGTTQFNQTLESAFETEVAWVDPILLKVDREKVQVADGKLILQSNRPITSVDIEVFDNDGKKIRETTQAMGGLKGNLEVKWAKTGGEVGAIRLKATDTAGFWNAVVLEPFWVEIPHKEVIFDFGKATWQGSETPKLTETLKGIKDAMKKHQKKGLQMQLYIAGYTDTVGNNADNKKLSNARAKAIAKWFRKSGLKIPIYYQGFGESVLAVKTKDNTPEEKNRRALYILGNSPPPRSGQLPASKWGKL